jgi:transcriptional regulator with XRE-family HTH domain
MGKTLGQFIRELREKLDISGRELAKMLDISAAHESDIELGRRFPSDDLLAKMAKALRTSVDELKKYDSRVPVEELKQASAEDPAYGFALRQMLENRVKPDDILKLVEAKRRKKDNDNTDF